MAKVSELFANIGYSLPTSLGPMQDTATAGSGVAVAKANRDAVTATETGKLRLSTTSTDKALEISDQRTKLEAAQRAHTAELGNSLSQIFKSSSADVARNLEIGQNVALEANDLVQQLAQTREQQNTTANPLKKLQLWWTGKNLEDSAINKTQEASSYFKSAKIIADTTTEKIQQVQSADVLTKGLELQLQDQQIASDAKRLQTETAAMSNVLGQVADSQKNIFDASAGVFSLISQEASRKAEDALRNRQQAAFDKEMADKNFAADVWLRLQDKPNTPENRNAALFATGNMTPQEKQLLGTYGLVTNGKSGQAAQQAVLKGMSVAEINQIGKTLNIPWAAGYGVNERNNEIMRVIDTGARSLWEAEKAAKKTTKTYEMWFKDDPQEVKMLRQKSVDDVNARFDTARGVDIAPMLNKTASVPANFDLQASITDTNVGFLTKHWKNPRTQQLVAEGLKPDGSITQHYKLILGELRGKIDASMDGVQIQGIALARALLRDGKVKDEAEGITVASEMLKVVARRGLETTSTGDTLLNAGMNDLFAPSLPVNVNGLRYDATKAVDLMRLNEEIKRQEKDSVGFFDPGGNPLGNAWRDRGASEKAAIAADVQSQNVMSSQLDAVIKEVKGVGKVIGTATGGGKK